MTQDRTKAAFEPPLDCDVRGWQPIATAPREDHKQLLLSGTTADGAWVIGTGYWLESLGAFVERGTLFEGWTHWAPLPAAPNVK